MLILPILLALPAFQPAPTPTFGEVVTEHFQAWDRDQDGTLSPVEVDALCVDPALTGAPAAAAAAIKRIIRSGKYDVKPLTREYLAAARPPAGKPAPGDADRADSPERTDATDRADSPENPGTPAAPSAPATPIITLRPPNFQASYASSLRRITSAQRALFMDDTPDLDKCRQGPLGNCFFVASVGAMVHRDPQSVKTMITPRDDGSYDVRFGDGSSVLVPALTDAELALSGTTGDEGVWLPVLEKAMGLSRRQANPKRYTMLTPTDAIATGGSTATVVRMLTGHQTQRITLKRRPRSTEKGPDGKPIELPPVPAGEPDQLAAKVRDAVGLALTERRLVTCGTGTEKQPPGISGKHAYAVTAFDPDTDTLTLWNPHGNTFRPKGEPGIERGYPTRAGVFSLPVADFVRIFGGVAIELDKPLEPPAAKTPGDTPAPPPAPGA